MANKIMMEFAQSRGLPLQGDTIITEEGGYIISYGVIQAGNATQYAVSIPVAEESWSKDKLKELRQSFKSVAGVGYAKAQKLVQLTVAGMGKKTILQKFAQVNERIVGELSRLDIAPGNTCKFCGMPGTDDVVLEGAVGLPTHRRCKEERAHELLQQIEHNEEHGNVFLGLLGAIVGGIVGCIPSFITAHFFDTIFSLLFALIPMGAYMGYKLFKGVLNAAVPFIISLISVLCTILLVLSYNYSYVVAQLNIPLSVGAFLKIVTASDMIGYLIQDMGMPLLFCVLGIVIAWSAISKGNKQKRKEAEALRQSIGS